MKHRRRVDLRLTGSLDINKFGWVRDLIFLLIIVVRRRWRIGIDDGYLRIFIESYSEVIRVVDYLFFAKGEVSRIRCVVRRCVLRYLCYIGVLGALSLDEWGLLVVIALAVFEFLGHF